MLLLAKLCKFLESVMVPWVMETVAASFASGGQAGGPGGPGGGGDLLPPSFVPGEVGNLRGRWARCSVVRWHETA